MFEIVQHVFNAENFIIAFVVWAFIASCRKAVKQFPRPRIAYFILAVLVTPAVAALFIAKTGSGEWNWINWGWASVVSFVIANLYQKTLKQIGSLEAIKSLKKNK